ncbi:hypothetical protein [Propionivibrio sp.]|uniref:hypothetical protein n=1 Tax=Propionivibrio sp. TaxID=2212460 RepID=UPI003BF11361
MSRNTTPPRIRVRSIIDRINAQGASLIYQQTALYPVLETIVRIREKSRDQLGDFEAHILKFVSLGVLDQSEISFVTGFPEEKLLPILHELAGRGLLAQERATNTRFTISELGRLTIQYGAEVLETDRAILLCGLTGRLLPRELYSIPALDPSQLRGARFIPDLIRENSEITLSYLNLDLIANKRSVNIPDEAIEICGVIADSAAPKFLECEILLFNVSGNTKVELYFSEGKVDWLNVSDVLGLLEPLGYPNSTPSQVVGVLAEELRKFGLVLEDSGTLDSNGNPVFRLAGAEDKFFSQKVAGRLYALHVGTEKHHARPVSGFPRILKGRAVSLFSAPGSPFEKDIERIRFIDGVIGELRLKKLATPELLAEALAARAPENGFKFDELEKAAIRTMDNMFISAIKGEASSTKPS